MNEVIEYIQDRRHELWASERNYRGSSADDYHRKYQGFLTYLLFNYTDHKCEHGCKSCGLGLRLTLSQVKRIYKFVETLWAWQEHYPPVLWRHIIHFESKEKCLVCLVDNTTRELQGQYSTSIESGFLLK